MTDTGTDRGNRTDFQAKISNARQSPLRKYADIAVGSQNLTALAKYELACWLLAPMPGALGFLLRGRVYRSMLGSCGRGLIMGRNVTIRCPGSVRIGSGVFVDDNCVLDAKGDGETGISLADGVVIARNTSLSCKGGGIEIGESSNISGNCMLISETRLSIGRNVLVAGMTYMVAGGNHGIDRTDIPIIRQECVQRGGIIIEDNAWIGAAVTILDGVTIGRDSVIGAGAVVTQNIPEFAIAVGTPARVIRKRE